MVEILKPGLVNILNFKFSRDTDVCWCRDFEVGAWSIFWRWNLIKFCVWTCDMTKKSYFCKPNSTLGSISPLTMFFIFNRPIAEIYEFIPFMNDLITFILPPRKNITINLWICLLLEHTNKEVRCPQRPNLIPLFSNFSPPHNK